MKRIHYLLLGLLVSLTIAAVSPSLPPTRIIAGSNVTVTTNGVNNFTVAASGSSGVGLGDTNVWTGTNRFTLPVVATNTGSVFAGDGSSLSLGTNAPLLSGTNTWSNTNTFNGRVVMGGGSTIYGGSSDLLLNTATGAYLSYGSGASRGSLGVAPIVQYTYGGSEVMRLSTSGAFTVGKAGSDSRTTFTQMNSTNVVRISAYGTADGTAIELLKMSQPDTPSAGCVRLYATNVVSTARLYGMAEDGTTFLLTPHMKDSPGKAVDGSDPNPIVFHESNAFLGRERFVHLTAAVREIERLSGKKFIFDRDIPKRDWDESQAANKKLHDQRRAEAEAELKAWQEDAGALKGPRPVVPPPFEAKPNPFKRD